MTQHRERRKSTKKNIVIRRLIYIIAMLIALDAVLALAIGYDVPPFSRAPIMELRGEDTVHVYLGDTYIDPGCSARTYSGRSISDKVTTEMDDEISGTRMDRAGTFQINYTVWHNLRRATASRTVIVDYREPDESDPYYGHGIAICMYHNVYDEADPPENLNANYISTDDLRSHLDYLVENEYYFPTWKEIADYVNGRIELPVKSVVLTFDDCTKGFQKYGIPILEEYNVVATSFVICNKNGEDVMKKYGTLEHVNFQSHSYGMHTGGGHIGHGGIMTELSIDEAKADLERSIKILGSNEAFAYPFGDTNETAEAAVMLAGFQCAVTTVDGSCRPGDDALLLPRRRVNIGLSKDGFAAMIEQDFEAGNITFY